jgi:HAAS
MDRIDGYLDALVAHLECDPLRRDEIRLEVHTHLRELVASERRQGKSEEDAALAAIRRFGPVEEVAARLSDVHRGQPADPVRLDRPWAAFGMEALASIAIWVVAAAGTMWTHQAALHLMDLEAPHTGEATDVQLWGSTFNVAPGLAITVVSLLLYSLIARHYAPRRAWLWAAIGYLLAPVLGTAVGMGSMIVQGSFERAYPSEWILTTLYRWPTGLIEGLAPVILVTLGLPWIARALSRDARPAWRPLLVLLLVACAALGHWLAMVLGLEHLEKTHALAPLWLRLTWWPLPRLLAALLAMWCAGWVVLPVAGVLRPRSAAVRAACLALLVGAAASLGLLLALPRGGPEYWTTVIGGAAYPVLLALGAAVLTLVRLSGREAEREPVAEGAPVVA